MIEISFVGFLICACFVASLQLKIFWMLAGFSLAIRQLAVHINEK